MSGMYSRGSRRGLGIQKNPTSHSRSNIPDMREKKRGTRTRKGDATEGDFEKMFGKDIDQFLEESEWDIDSYEKMSQFSKDSGRNGCVVFLHERRCADCNDDCGAKEHFGRRELITRGGAKQGHAIKCGSPKTI